EAAHVAGQRRGPRLRHGDACYGRNPGRARAASNHRCVVDRPGARRVRVVDARLSAPLRRLEPCRNGAMMARVLVTGGFGTIGRWVLRALLERGHDVTTLELDTPRTRKIAREMPRVRVAWGDLRDAASVAAAVKGQEYVVHMAFVLTPHTEIDPE